MKKIILLSAIILTWISFWFAQTTGSTQVTIYNTLDSNKNMLLSWLDLKKNDLSSKAKTLKDSLSWDVNYNILNWLGNLDVSTIDTQIINDFFSYKTTILSDYFLINSKILILDDKKSLWLISDSDYNIEKTKLENDIKAYYEKYNVVISWYNSSIINKINDFNSSFSKLKLDNKSQLDNIKSRADKLISIKKLYSEYISNLNKINSIYVGSYWDIQTFFNDTKSVLINFLKSSLENNIDSYLKKYTNLSYYSKDIYSYEESLIKSFDIDITNYFNTIFSWFYSKSDIDFIDSNYATFVAKFVVSWDVTDYLLVSQSSSFDSEFDKINSKLTEVNSWIVSKLKEFNSDADIWNFKLSLKTKLENLFESSKQEKINLMKLNIDKQIEFLWFKTSQELDSYNVLMDRISFAWTDYDSLVSTKKSLEDYQKNIISKDLKNSIKAKLKEIDIKLINSAITKDGLWIYEFKYPGIDSKLKAILTKLYSDYSAQNRWEEFIQKLDNTLVKIDSLLSSSSWKTKFLLLKIKKAVLDFKSSN